jgi:hypothetical protein
LQRIRTKRLSNRFDLNKNMAERRKIIIETGADPDEPLPTPHFDAEATLTARPVVPLNDQETYQMHYGGRAQKPFWKRPVLLALIVLVAVGIGVAAGLTIGMYRNRQAAETPVAATPPSAAEDAAADQVIEEPQPQPPVTQEARAVVPDEPEEEEGAPAPAAEPKVEERERTTRSERKADDDEARQPAAAKPAVVRDKKPIKVDEYIIEDGREARRAEKEQRREERRAERRERRRRERGGEINIERAGREVDRIREIFEGRQP